MPDWERKYMGRWKMPNDDYILRSDALKATCENCTEHYVCNGKCDDTDRLRKIPAADVEPKRKTGVWLEEEATDDGNWRYICSVCGYADIQSRSAQVPYCWHCGSRMRKMSEVADNGSVQ